jgi:hypothetical protein
MPVLALSAEILHLHCSGIKACDILFNIKSLRLLVTVIPPIMLSD